MWSKSELSFYVLCDLYSTINSIKPSTPRLNDNADFIQQMILYRSTLPDYYQSCVGGWWLVVAKVEKFSKKPCGFLSFRHHIISHYGGGTIFTYSLVQKLAVSVASRPNRVGKCCCLRHRQQISSSSMGTHARISKQVPIICIWGQARSESSN